MSQNQEPKHKYFNLKSQDLKTQLQNLEIEMFLDQNPSRFLFFL